MLFEYIIFHFIDFPYSDAGTTVFNVFVSWIIKDGAEV